MLSYYLVPLYYSTIEETQAIYASIKTYTLGNNKIHRLLVNWTATANGTASYIFDRFNSFNIRGRILNIFTATNNKASTTNYSVELLDLVGNDILQQQLTSIEYDYTQVWSPYKESANTNIDIYGQSKLTLYISNATAGSVGTIKIILLEPGVSEEIAQGLAANTLSPLGFSRLSL